MLRKHSMPVQQNDEHALEYHDAQHHDEHNDETRTGTFPVVKQHSIAVFRSELWRKVSTRSMVTLLCALLAFGYMIQVHNTTDSYASLSEDELVRLLDQTNSQVNQLEAQKSKLTAQLAAVQSAANKQEESEKIARENEQTMGILSGRLPAQGKGISAYIEQGSTHIPASMMFTLIEELRNAGAEVIQINNVRIVTSTYVIDKGDGLNINGTTIHSPYTVLAIGNPSTLQNAIGIAGGIGSHLKSLHANVEVVAEDNITISSVYHQKKYSVARIEE